MISILCNIHNTVYYIKYLKIKKLINSFIIRCYYENISDIKITSSLSLSPFSKLKMHSNRTVAATFETTCSDKVSTILNHRHLWSSKFWYRVKLKTLSVVAKLLKKNKNKTYFKLPLKHLLLITGVFLISSIPSANTLDGDLKKKNGVLVSTY